MARIIWKYIEGKPEKAGFLDIERFFDIKLPQDYIDCIKENNGGTPFPHAFDTQKTKGEMINNLVNIIPGNDDGTPIESYEMIKDRLPGKIIPFAEDGGGNMICFDYRNTDNNPKIVFWDHEIAYHNPEEGIIPICDTFTELIESLYESDDD